MDCTESISYPTGGPVGFADLSLQRPFSREIAIVEGPMRCKWFNGGRLFCGRHIAVCYDCCGRHLESACYPGQTALGECLLL
jgi:hypothetical protein